MKACNMTSSIILREGKFLCACGIPPQRTCSSANQEYMNGSEVPMSVCKIAITGCLRFWKLLILIGIFRDFQKKYKFRIP